MAGAHPRSSDYPENNPDSVNLSADPYAIDLKRKPGNESRDVEPNTSGRSSMTPLSPRPGYVSGDVTAVCTSTGQDALSPYGSAPADHGASQGHVTTPDLRKAGKEDGPARVAAGSNAAQGEAQNVKWS